MASYKPTEFVTHKGITFGRATEAYNEVTVNPFTKEEIYHHYKGMPLFDGDPAHLDIYVDLLLTELGTEGIISVAADTKIIGHYGDGKTYELPANTLYGNDCTVNGETQWPVQMGMAQTWNKELLKKAGNAVGEEIRGLASNNSISGSRSAISSSAIIDIRYNPLIGRFDEGFGEDPFLISEMAAHWTDGIAGRKSKDDLYYRVIPQTKHWGSYQGEFFRGQNSNNVSVRSFYEQNAKAVDKTFREGNFLGLMSSYGSINGVPSTASFMQKYAQKLSGGSMMTLCDAGSESGYVPASAEGSGFANGYDHTYSSSFTDRIASMLLAGHNPGKGRTMDGLVIDLEGDTKAAIEHGVNGLTEEDVKLVARTYLLAAIRCGALDERDEFGHPKFYPFNSQAKDGEEKKDHTDLDHQKLALEAARESIVLTKNDGSLPLDKGTAAVFGQMADVVQYGLYTSRMFDTESYCATAPAGLSITEALKVKLGVESVRIETGGKVFQIIANGKYLTAHEDDTLTFEDAPSEGSRFELADWGQTVVSIRSCKTGKWIKTGAHNTMFDPPEEDEAPTGFVPGPDALLHGSGHPSCYRDLIARVDDDAKFRPDLSGPFLPSFGFPEFYEVKPLDNGFALKCGSKFNTVDFGTRSATPDLMGWYLCARHGKLMVDADPYSARSTARETEKEGLTSDYRFISDVISVPGATASENAKKTDCAVIVLGMLYNGINGEGTDRITMNLGADQLEMAHRVAAEYAAVGKPAVVIVKMDSPVAVQELQDDPNISAILTMPTCGQYEAAALIDILYGEVSPRGRLNATWYSGDEALPKITKYSLPYEAKVSIPGDVNGRIVKFEDICAKVDFTAADLQQSRMTHQYYVEKVTYPFGYGLSYTTFNWHNLRCPEIVKAGESFKAHVDVTNTGVVDSYEVVQLYLCPRASVYGEFAPRKLLASFEKVYIPAGETRTVTLTVEPGAIALWDVNSHCYRVEPGEYILCAAKDSGLEDGVSSHLIVEGNPITSCDLSGAVNLWSHSFGAKNVVYREYQKNQTAAALRGTPDKWDEAFAVMSAAEGAWTVLKSVRLDGLKKAVLTVGSENSESTVELHMDSPDGKLLGSVSFACTGESIVPRYAVDPDFDAGMIHEMAYTAAVTTLAPETGDHDLYVVFLQPDTRAFEIVFE